MFCACLQVGLWICVREAILKLLLLNVQILHII